MILSAHFPLFQAIGINLHASIGVISDRRLTFCFFSSVETSRMIWWLFETFSIVEQYQIENCFFDPRKDLFLLVLSQSFCQRAFLNPSLGQTVPEALIGWNKRELHLSLCPDLPLGSTNIAPSLIAFVINFKYFSCCSSSLHRWHLWHARLMGTVCFDSNIGSFVNKCALLPTLGCISDHCLEPRWFLHY